VKLLLSFCVVTKACEKCVRFISKVFDDSALHEHIGELKSFCRPPSWTSGGPQQQLDNPLQSYGHFSTVYPRWPLATMLDFCRFLEL